MIARTEGPPVVPATGRPVSGEAGIVARVGVAMALGAAVAVLPAVVGPVGDDRITVMAVFGMLGLSLNMLLGYVGQVSLGQQGVAGIGAFVSAWIATHAGGAGFFVALPAGAAVGAVIAALLGLAAMRARGLRLAILTFAFGILAESTIFRWHPFAPGAAGLAAPRPAAFSTPRSYAYLCVMVLAVFTWFDWRISRSKAGRAMAAVRQDERSAAAVGVNVLGTKVLAFATSGLFAGAAGALFAHWRGVARPADFTLLVALTWGLMTVVGGPGSRAGVLVSSAFFGLLPLLLPAHAVHVPFLGQRSIAFLSPLLAAVLVLLTLTLYPGGLGRRLLPLRRWLAGGPFLQPAPFAWELAVPPGMGDATEETASGPPARPGEWTARRRARAARGARDRRGTGPREEGD
jgi:branched-chain amino acid transport system permease protein